MAKNLLKHGHQGDRCVDPSAGPPRRDALCDCGAAMFAAASCRPTPRRKLTSSVVAVVKRANRSTWSSMGDNGAVSKLRQGADLVMQCANGCHRPSAKVAGRSGLPKSGHELLDGTDVRRPCARRSRASSPFMSSGSAPAYAAAESILYPRPSAQGSFDWANAPGIGSLVKTVKPAAGRRSYRNRGRRPWRSPPKARR